MGVSTSCILMVGLPYKELKALVEGFDEDIYNTNLDERINNGEVEIGSVYYDSTREDNIIGLSVQSTKSWTELTEDVLYGNSSAAVKELEGMFPPVEWKLYLTLDVT